MQGARDYLVPEKVLLEFNIIAYFIIVLSELTNISLAPCPLLLAPRLKQAELAKVELYQFVLSYI